MNVSYEKTTTREGEVYTSPGASALLSKVDAVVFDCDGTLIDVRESYDATVLETAEAMTGGFFGRALPIERVGREFILAIRRTGGFNSDWDLTYALSLFSAVALEGLSDKEQALALERLNRIIADFSSRERLEGWKSVDRFLVSERMESKGVKDLRSYLGYPGTALTSRMASAFDQLYYGEKLYSRIYAVKPPAGRAEGLIDRERVIVTTESLDSLQEILGEKKMAMATGRPHVAVEYTIGSMLDYFERDASVYIGDGDIFPELEPELAEYKKPSGASLLLAKQKMASKILLYVGDSAEDRLMVRNAGLPEGSIIFAGVYGSSFSEKEQIAYFSETESEVIVKSVNQIPRLLEAARG